MKVSKYSLVRFARMQTRSVRPLGLACLVILLASLSSPAQSAELEIRIFNLSARDGFGGQNFTAPAVILHTPSFQLFKVGEPSSEAVWKMAEDGDGSVARDLVNQVSSVRSTHSGSRTGRDQSRPTIFKINYNHESGLLFSMVSMLSVSNDGFLGVADVVLPETIGEKVIVMGMAYDAGSEFNSENCPEVPCGPHYIRLTENAEGRVQLHPGILGVGGIDPRDRGWPKHNQIARIEVIRTR